MPYENHSRLLDVDTGKMNPQLLELARRMANSSPPLQDEITLNDQVRYTKEKEFVGLVFNRTVMDSLRNRKEILEKAQERLKVAVITMGYLLEDSDAVDDSSIRAAVGDRMFILSMGSRIRQLEGLVVLLTAYNENLQELVEFYRPYQAFLKQCADRMQFRNEMNIINRYKTLTLVKTEMKDLQISNREELAYNAQFLAQMNSDNERTLLEYSTDISTKYNKHRHMARENLEHEESLTSELSRASETIRKTYHIGSGIRRVYENIMHYRKVEPTLCDPFDMLEVIERRFVNLKGVVHFIYRIRESEKKPTVADDVRRSNYQKRATIKKSTKRKIFGLGKKSTKGRTKSSDVKKDEKAGKPASPSISTENTKTSASTTGRKSVVNRITKGLPKNLSQRRIAQTRNSAPDIAPPPAEIKAPPPPEIKVESKDDSFSNNTLHTHKTHHTLTNTNHNRLPPIREMDVTDNRSKGNKSRNGTRQKMFSTQSNSKPEIRLPRITNCSTNSTQKTELLLNRKWKC